MEADYNQKHLEWEYFQPIEEVTHLIFENGLYSLNDKCIINFSRDAQYDIDASISGIHSHRDELEPNIEDKSGTFYPNEIILGYSKTGIHKFRFHGAVIGKHTSRPFSIEEGLSSFKAKLMTHKIEQILNQETLPKITSIHEWYLSGPISMHFPRTTKRTLDKTFKRSREMSDANNDSRTVKSSSSSSDYLFVETEEISFVVAKTPKELGPEWSFNLSIEYRRIADKLPDEEKRKAVAELISFVFGTQLLKIGESHFDKHENIISRIFENPWGDNVFSKCQKWASPPVEISTFTHRTKAEMLLTDLLPFYLKLRNQFKLKDSLWKYWLARYSVIGANLPILSSAVETLAERLLKENNKIKRHYIEASIFSDLLDDELLSLDSKLETYLLGKFDSVKAKEIKEIIVRKLKGASQRGANEKLIMMFEILGLPVGKIENKAIQARNKMAHSSMDDADNNELLKIVRLTRAYETLFHRIFLKILGYKGTYIDYYTLGHPNRYIDDLIPESE